MPGETRAALGAEAHTARLVARKQLTNSNGENQIGQRYDSGSVGIEVSIPLYSGGRTSAASGQAFFKQKTAYEISECDWSSDVCSSD
eukprot:COSAG06_NODE_59702_length_273_cov_0.718391_1_plen_86_part_10